MTAPLLSFALDRPGREHLVVDAGGRVRYLILEAAHPQWADRAGLFQAQLSPERLESATTIARDLAATTPTPRGRSGPVVTATVSGQEATHPLAGPGHAASDLLSDLIDLARDHPVSVVRFGAEVINGVDLRLRWEGVGATELGLRLIRESCRVSVRSKGVWGEVWRSTPTTRLALVAAPHGFVDGVNSPATLEPGTIARAVLAAAVSGTDDDWDLASVEIAGWVVLPDLESVDDDNPFEPGDTSPDEWPIRLRAVVAPP